MIDLESNREKESRYGSDTETGSMGFRKFSVRVKMDTADWLLSAYELYRGDEIFQKRKPVSLNRFMVSLLIDSLASDAPLGIVK